VGLDADEDLCLLDHHAVEVHHLQGEHAGFTLCRCGCRFDRAHPPSQCVDMVVMRGPVGFDLPAEVVKGSQQTPEPPKDHKARNEKSSQCAELKKKGHPINLGGAAQRPECRSWHDRYASRRISTSAGSSGLWPAPLPLCWMRGSQPQ
jgi:hypothetical protein